MLIEDWRPKMFCKDIECQNLSINGRVLEEGHKYYHEDDAQDNTVLPLKIASMLSDLDRIDQGFS
jgi:hypothetical protein